LPDILFTDGAQFARDGIINPGNSHSWVGVHPQQVDTISLATKVFINVWCGLSENNVNAPHVIERRLTSPCYSSGKLATSVFTGSVLTT